MRHHGTMSLAAAAYYTTARTPPLRILDAFFHTTFEKHRFRRCVIEVFDPLPDQCLIGWRTPRHVELVGVELGEGEERYTEVRRAIEASKSLPEGLSLDFLMLVNDVMSPLDATRLETSVVHLLELLESDHGKTLRVLIECTADTAIWSTEGVDGLVRLGYNVVGIQLPPRVVPLEPRSCTSARVGASLPAFMFMSPSVQSLIVEHNIRETSFESTFDVWIET
jgi:hypothetical protein